MTEHTDDFATRPDAIPEIMALADKCGPHAVAVLIALDRWQAAIIAGAEAATVERIAAWLEARPCHAEGHDIRWCATCSHDGDTADAIRRGDWKGEA